MLNNNNENNELNENQEIEKNMSDENINSNTDTENTVTTDNSELNIESSVNTDIDVKDLEDNSNGNIINYLDPSIINIKKYDYDELNENDGLNIDSVDDESYNLGADTKEKRSSSRASS